MKERKKNKLIDKFIGIAVLILVIIALIYFIVTGLDTKLMIEWFPYISEGLWITLYLALISSVLGASLGIILALLKNSKVTLLEKFVDAYVDLFRGTPLLVQLFIIYFALPEIGITFDPLFCCILTFSLNSAAYISEIIRSGINSIEKGQVEAAECLGIKKTYIYKDIIFPIAIKNILPSLMNEFITLVKETSIVSVIGVADLMRRYSIVSSQTFRNFEPLVIIAIIYYIVIKILTIISRKIEEKLKYA